MLPPFSPDGSFPSYSSFAPSPSPSVSSFASSPSPSIPDSSPALKCRRTSSTQQSSGWTAANQAEFGEDLCKLFVTCGWSWNDANNPEFKLFFEKYLPAAQIPDRRVLSGTILTGEANKVIAATRNKIKGKMATYVEDGWKNVAHMHIDTSVLCVEGQLYLLKTHDMTGRPKTGDELFEIMKSDFLHAWETYRIEIIAVCTDDGPDGKKARRLIREWKCSITVFECWAHQSSLMTGNYLAIKAPWMKDAKDALEVVKWFNNYGKALDLLRAQQMLIFTVVLRLLLPVVTRWTIHYCCLQRAKKLERSFRACVVTHEEVLKFCAGRKEEQIAAAEFVIATCNRPSFWINIGRIIQHLELLAIAANVLQAPDCRLDTVLLTLANLFRIFSNLNQELMILAVFFNPYLRAPCFKYDVLPANKIFHLVRHAFQRLLGQDATGDMNFLNAFREYYDRQGWRFSHSSLFLLLSADFIPQKKTVNLVWIWRQLEGESCTGRSGFIKLVIRILSILPNSAGAERVFSVFGLTHTKHHNRLEPQKVHDVTTVGMDRQKAHIAAGLTIARKARHFSLADDDPEVSVTEVMDFDTMAENVISLVNEEDAAEDDEDPESTPQVPPAHPNPPPSAAKTVTSATACIPVYKKIKLADPFNYPSKDSPAADFEYFWQGGRDGVDAEEEALANEANETAPSAGAADVVEAMQT
ncbi:ribonuclease H-like domain-containing protein [Mycena latifolia]|nr:ribonuclease H-like domain-containing protein [Mycena latifolia]